MIIKHNPSDIVKRELQDGFHTLPMKVQDFLMKTEKKIASLLMYWNKFYRLYPELKEGTEYEVSDIKIDSFKKYDYAKYIDNAYKWDKSVTNHNYRIPLVEYKWFITLDVWDKSLDVSFSYNISDVMNKYLSNQSRVERWEKHLDDDFFHFVKLANSSNVLFFNWDKNKWTPDNKITKRIWKDIAKFIDEYYSYRETILRPKYRREDIKLENLPSKMDLEKQEIEDFKLLDKKNVLSGDIFYRGNWASLYKEVTEGDHYKTIYDDEKEIIEGHESEILNLIWDNKIFVDMWSWDWEKILQLVSNYNEDIEYIAEDSSVSFLMELWQTKANINRSKLRNSKLKYSDFQDNKELKELKKKTLFFMWGSIWNMETEDLPFFFDNIYNTLNKDECLIIWVHLYDKWRSIEDIKYPYLWEKNEKFILNWFKKIGVDEELIEHRVEYDPNSHTVMISWKCKEDLEFNIWLQKWEKSQWTKILAFRSKRFALDELEEFCENSNLNLQEIWRKGWQGIFAISK